MCELCKFKETLVRLRHILHLLLTLQSYGGYQIFHTVCSDDSLAMRHSCIVKNANHPVTRVEAHYQIHLVLSIVIFVDD